MFRILVSRQAQHAIDMNAMELVRPAYVSHAPNVAEEAEHMAPSGSPLWNESWYFDVVTPDGSLGMYARLGRLPNQNRCNFVGGIFRRNEKPLMFINDDHAAGEHTTHPNIPATLPPSWSFSTPAPDITQSHHQPSQRASLQNESAASLRRELERDGGLLVRRATSPPR